jgi:hypothetical protein
VLLFHFQKSGGLATNLYSMNLQKKKKKKKRRRRKKRKEKKRKKEDDAVHLKIIQHLVRD